MAQIDAFRQNLVAALVHRTACINEAPQFTTEFWQSCEYKVNQLLDDLYAA